MTIMNFISNHIIIVAIFIIVLFFIFRYLMSSGYFKKIGLDFDTASFKKTIQDMQGEDDFFASAEEVKEKSKDKKDNDFFDTNLNFDNNLEGGKI